MLDGWQRITYGSAYNEFYVVLIMNTFGGKVEITNNESDSSVCGDLQNEAKISFSSIPQEACIDIASQDWSALNPEAVCVGKGSGTICSGFINGVEDAIAKCNKEYNILSFVIK